MLDFILLKNWSIWITFTNPGHGAERLMQPSQLQTEQCSSCPNSPHSSSGLFLSVWVGREVSRPDKIRCSDENQTIKSTVEVIASDPPFFKVTCRIHKSTLYIFVRAKIMKISENWLLSVLDFYKWLTCGFMMQRQWQMLTFLRQKNEDVYLIVNPIRGKRVLLWIGQVTFLLDWRSFEISQDSNKDTSIVVFH